MKRSILGILELIAVAGSRTVEWVTAKGGVSFGEEEEEEEERKGGGDCWSWWRCGLVSSDKARVLPGMDLQMSWSDEWGSTVLIDL